MFYAVLGQVESLGGEKGPVGRLQMTGLPGNLGTLKPKSAQLPFAFVRSSPERSMRGMSAICTNPKRMTG